MNRRNALERLVFREVDRSRWGDLERLFESRGGPKSCWCMVWRAVGSEARKTDGRSRKSALKRRVDAGVPVGILAYLDEEPVAWCSIAPRETYRSLGGAAEPGDVPGSVWSLVCFYVSRPLRGAGITRRLIDAAVAAAARLGARAVEAYPVDPDDVRRVRQGSLTHFNDFRLPVVSPSQVVDDSLENSSRDRPRARRSRPACAPRSGAPGRFRAPVAREP